MDEKVQVQEPTKLYKAHIICSISYLAIIGSLIRNGLDLFFKNDVNSLESPDSVFVLASVANMFGCFVMGWLFVKDKPKTPQYIGLTTGLCGSITTYSKFNHQASLLFLGKSSLETPNSQVNAVFAIIVWLHVSMSSWTVGKDLSCKFKNDFLAKDFRKNSFFLSLTVLLLLIIVLVILLVLYFPENTSLSTICFSGLLAPLGGLMRYYLGQHVPRFSCKKIPILTLIPTGTLVANFIGSMLLSLLYVLEQVYVTSPNQKMFVVGVSSGFLACLTTVSSFVNEVQILRIKSLKASYLYITLTLVLCISISCITIGIASIFLESL